MGAVHVGRVRGVEGFSRLVAIKCMLDTVASDPEYVTMFLDEARMASRIRHVNVVPTLDVVRDQESFWIVMEYVAGTSLSTLARLGPIPPSIAVAIFGDVLSGLDAAHNAVDEDGTSLALVHRDVSPHNVLVGTDGIARLADFGIARARNRSAVTRTGEFKGKLAYTDPSVVRGHPATVRSDVYSAGATLWEMLAGRPLFTGETESVLLYNVLESQPQPLSRVVPELGTAFDGVLARALDKDPSARFESARELRDAVEQCWGAPATRRDVAMWLESVAGDTLRAHAEVVRSFEVGRPVESAATQEAAATIASDPLFSTTPETPVPVSTSAGKAPRARTGAVLLVAGTAAVALLAGAAAIHASGTLRAPGAEATPVHTATARDEALADPPVPSLDIGERVQPQDPTQGEATIVAPSLLDEEVAPKKQGGSVTAPRSPKKASRSEKAVPAAAAAECTPPYTIDAFGDKHYKAECFR
jgi:eukaryotic-like serine/threonine-protein kinase